MWLDLIICSTQTEEVHKKKQKKKNSLKNKLYGYFKAYQDSTVLHVAEVYKAHSQLCNTSWALKPKTKKQWRGYACVKQVVYRKPLYLAVQFCCEPKTTLNNK